MVAATDEEDGYDSETDALCDDDMRSDDSSLQHFAADVVDGLYTTVRRKLKGEAGGGPDGGHDNYNDSNVVASADHVCQYSS